MTRHLAISTETRSRLSLRGRLCLALSRPALHSAAPDAVPSADDYAGWRDASLSASWSRFSDAHVNGRDVLDFGCGAGPLSLFLAATRTPRSITGVDLYARDIERAREALARMAPAPAMPVRFLLGDPARIPVDDASADTLLAFDCLEHVMEPEAILAEWRRVLRPGGRVLIEWFPYAGPYGPHMNALIPIPWAHYLFGQRAMFEAAEALYDDPAYRPRHWDMDASGAKLPNKWRQWRSFAEQAYINELSERDFRRMARDAGFRFTRFERHGVLSNNPAAAPLSRIAAHLPVVGQFITSHIVIEMQRGDGASI